MSKVKATIYGLGLGLGLWAMTAVAAFAFMATTEHIKQARLVPPKLPAWSDQHILSELGEAAQVMPCDEIIGAPGMTARFFVQEDARRLIVVCTVK